jgi:Ni,Fe-hydrogenase I small subunit
MASNETKTDLEILLREVLDAVGDEDLERANSYCACASETTRDRVGLALERARAFLAQGWLPRCSECGSIACSHIPVPSPGSASIAKVDGRG